MTRRQSVRVALTFPGQGSQSAGMGAPWRESVHWAIVAAASEALGRDLEHLLLEADDDLLRRTDNAQLATLLVSLMALAAMRESQPGLDEVTAAGHSLGEYAALVAAGAISADSVVALVAARGAAMAGAAEREPGTMAAVLNLSAQAVADAISQAEGCWIANLNGEGNVILTGTRDGVAAGSQACLDAGARRVLPLSVGGAFHSPLMAPAAAELMVALEAAQWSDARMPVICNVDADAHTARGEWTDLLSRQLVSPVRWTECIQRVGASGIDVVVELGPGKVLTGISRRALPEIATMSIGSPEDAAAAWA